MEDERLHLLWRACTLLVPQTQTQKRSKDIVKDNVKNLEIKVKNREKESENRFGLRTLVFDGCNRFEVKRAFEIEKGS